MEEQQQPAAILLLTSLIAMSKVVLLQRVDKNLSRSSPAPRSCWSARDLLLRPVFRRGSMMYVSETSKQSPALRSVIKNTNSFSRLQHFKVSFYPRSSLSRHLRPSVPRNNNILRTNIQLLQSAAQCSSVPATIAPNLHICKISDLSYILIQSSGYKSCHARYAPRLSCHIFFQCTDFETHCPTLHPRRTMAPVSRVF